jgi:hypothetical protein
MVNIKKNKEDNIFNFVN